MDYLLHSDLVSGNNHIFENGLELINYPLSSIYDRKIIGIDMYYTFQGLVMLDKKKLIEDGMYEIDVDEHILINTIMFLEKFIVCHEVKYNRKLNHYMVYVTDEEFVFLTVKDIKHIFDVFKKMYCMSEETEEKEVRFASSEVENALSEWMKEEEELNKRHNSSKGKLTINSVISYVSSKSYSLNISNIWNLTMFQLFDTYYQLLRNEKWEYTLTSVYNVMASKDVNLEKLRPDVSIY